MAEYVHSKPAEDRFFSPPDKVLGDAIIDFLQFVDPCKRGYPAFRRRPVLAIATKIKTHYLGKLCQSRIKLLHAQAWRNMPENMLSLSSHSGTAPASLPNPSLDCAELTTHSCTLVRQLAKIPRRYLNLTWTSGVR
jgi:hypothetical protein